MDFKHLKSQNSSGFVSAAASNAASVLSSAYSSHRSSRASSTQSSARSSHRSSRAGSKHSSRKSSRATSGTSTPFSVAFDTQDVDSQSSTVYHSACSTQCATPVQSKSVYDSQCATPLKTYTPIANSSNYSNAVIEQAKRYGDTKVVDQVKRTMQAPKPSYLFSSDALGDAVFSGIGHLDVSNYTRQRTVEDCHGNRVTDVEAVGFVKNVNVNTDIHPNTYVDYPASAITQQMAARYQPKDTLYTPNGDAVYT